MIVKKQTISKLDEIFDLRYQGFEQDWAIELADANRVKEFLLAASSNDFDPELRYALMELILASFNDKITNSREDKVTWKAIITLLRQNYDLYTDLLRYWAVTNERQEDLWFKITPLVRDFLKEKY